MDELLDLVKTTEDRRIMMTIADRVLSNSFTSKGDISAETAAESTMAQEVTKLLEDKGVGLKNAKDLEKEIGLIKKKVDALEIVKLTLAFDPDPKFVDMLAGWFRMNVGETILLDINVEPSILGGVCTVWRGYYKDLSLPQMMSNIDFGALFEEIKKRK